MSSTIIDNSLTEDCWCKVEYNYGYYCLIPYFKVKHNNKFGLYILLVSPIRDVQDYTIKAVGEIVPIFKGSDVLNKVTKVSFKEVMLNQLTYDL